MPSANLFDFVPDSPVGADQDPLKLSGFDQVVFNDEGVQPAPNRIPVLAQRPDVRQPGAISSAFLGTGLPQQFADLAASLGIPSQNLLQALNQSFLNSIFGNA